jgi:hypothetical protein
MKVGMWNKNRLTPPGAMLSISVNIKIGSLQTMMLFLEKGVSSEKKRLKQLSEEFSSSKGISDSDFSDAFQESLGDELWEAEQAEFFGRLLAIVGLYMLVENETKTILKWVFPEKQVFKVYKWRQLKDMLKKEIRFDIENLKMFKIVNELRCLNNDIKHNRKVGRELAQYVGWVYGKEITGKGIDFSKFKNAVPEYIKELSDGINEQLLKNKKQSKF